MCRQCWGKFGIHGYSATTRSSATVSCPAYSDFQSLKTWLFFESRAPRGSQKITVAYSSENRCKLEDLAIADELPQLTDVRVLVVDDDLDTLELIAFVLEQCQAKMITVNSVDAALAQFLQFKPDVLVSDIGMPEKDGYCLGRQIRQLDADQGNGSPAIALTAFVKAEDQQQAIASGFQRHLAKLVDPYELTVAIASLVKRSW
jgi:CheY-like chemotaxis protein